MVRRYALFLLVLFLFCFLFFEGSFFAQSTWVLSLGAKYVQETSDNGFIATGDIGGTGVYLSKFDANGNTIWTKLFGDSFCHAFCVRVTAGGGYIFAGTTSSAGAGSTDFLVVKFDASGNILWQKTFGETSAENQPNIIQTQDGNFVLVGTTSSFGEGYFDILVIKIDSSGQVIWSNSYGSEGYEYGYSLIENSNGNLLITGTVKPASGGSYDILLLYLSSTGSIISQEVLGGNYGDAGREIAHSSDGGFFITGEIGIGPSFTEVSIIKFSSGGGIIWQKSFNSSAKDFSLSATSTGDGGVLVAATRLSAGGWGDYWLIKLDNSGETIWQKIFSIANLQSTSFKIEGLADGGAIVCGTTFLVRIDANGSINNSCDLESTEAVVPMDTSVQEIPPNPPLVSNGANLTVNNAPFISSDPGYVSSFLCTGIVCPSMDITPSSLPDGQLTVVYNQVVSVSGGSPPYTYILSAGSLPAGLSLAADGTISGTPTSPGATQFSITAKDSAGCNISKFYTMNVTCPGLYINPSTLPNGMLNQLYSQTLTLSGGSVPVTFSLQSGSLPSGLTLSSAGIISGTPTKIGNFNFTVFAEDSIGCTSTKNYLLQVVCPSATFSPSSLPAGEVGSTYSQTISVTGGASPYTFSQSGGVLPSTLTISPGGVISGYCLEGGAFNFTISVEDKNGCIFSKDYSLTINCPSNLSISPSSIPNGYYLESYNQSFLVSGGVPPYTFSLISGKLPAGLTLSNDGLLSGIPTEKGIFSFTLKTVDGFKCTLQKSYSLTIEDICVTLDSPSLLYPCGNVIETTMPTIVWSNVSNANGYVVSFWDTNSLSQSPFYQSSPLPANTTSMQVPQCVLYNGKTYYFGIQALGDGTSYCNSSFDPLCQFSIRGAGPILTSIEKVSSPFRLKIVGASFNPTSQVFIGSDTYPWYKCAYKNNNLILLRGGKQLKDKFPKGVPVSIRVVNGDGQCAKMTFVRN